MRARLVVLELALLTSSIGCKPTPKREQPPLASTSTASARIRLLTPRSSSRFHARDGKLRQAHPRLPDTGEWRCAERGEVVWCVGGEAAAGVVSGPPDDSYRCGPRWGSVEGERVCIDEHPEYPEPPSTAASDVRWECKFEQEHGIVRVCEWGKRHGIAVRPSNTLPACWLDRDCLANRCDRGACGCRSSQDCELGLCSGGVCVEVTR